jgi:serine/threonine protein kinase
MPSSESLAANKNAIEIEIEIVECAGRLTVERHRVEGRALQERGAQLRPEPPSDAPHSTAVALSWTAWTASGVRRFAIRWRMGSHAGDEDEAAQTTPAIGNLETFPATASGGQTIASSRYVLGEVIGRGGMGEVRVAHDSWIGRDVAVKVLRGDHTPDDVFARFRREAQVQARLEHPSIVPVHDMGVDPHGRPFFVMKRLTGATLFEIITARPEHPEHWTRRSLLVRLVDVCQAIAFAHQRGVVHRDLKPSNIMLGDFGEVYVLDWGIARVRTRASGTIQHDDLGSIDDVTETQIGSVIGTPGYMAPEQMRGEPVERSFDIYALGCILFEILTGTTALPSGSEAFEATLNALPHRPRLRVPTADVPPELDELCSDATAPAINDRLRSVDNFARRLQRYLDGDRDEAQRQALQSS